MIWPLVGETGVFFPVVKLKTVAASRKNDGQMVEIETDVKIRLSAKRVQHVVEIKPQLLYIYLLAIEIEVMLPIFPEVKGVCWKHTHTGSPPSIHNDHFVSAMLNFGGCSW